MYDVDVDVDVVSWTINILYTLRLDTMINEWIYPFLDPSIF